MNERTGIYARRLSQMIKHETISENGQDMMEIFLPDGFFKEDLGLC